jgi:AraC family transcriptional regulator
MYTALTIDAELKVPAATAQLVQLSASGPVNVVMLERRECWLDLCLTPRPRNLRACYHQRWYRDRFEPLGQIFMVPAGESLTVRGEGGSSQTSVLCLLQPEHLREWFDGKANWSDGQLRAGLDIQSRNVRDLLLRLAKEIREPGFDSAMLTELIAAQLAIELRRYCRGTVKDASAGGLAPWRLQRIDERVRDGCGIPTLSELATLCSVSVRQLTRGFRLSRGCSIRQYVVDTLLERARQMLAGDASVKSISYALGFASPSSFCCAFRRAAQETPKQFRDHLRQLDRPRYSPHRGLRL